MNREIAILLATCALTTRPEPSPPHFKPAHRIKHALVTHFQDRGDLDARFAFVPIQPLQHRLVQLGAAWVVPPRLHQRLTAARTPAVNFVVAFRLVRLPAPRALKLSPRLSLRRALQLSRQAVFEQNVSNGSLGASERLSDLTCRKTLSRHCDHGVSIHAHFGSRHKEISRDTLPALAPSPPSLRQVSWSLPRILISPANPVLENVEVVCGLPSVGRLSRSFVDHEPRITVYGESCPIPHRLFPAPAIRNPAPRSNG